MSKVEYFVYIYHVFSLILIRNGHCVPIDYCLHPLNKSDCDMKPTPVFAYYKPGSRCEVEIWRGCPTFNKFPDEFLCSHYCIGKLLKYDDSNENMLLDNKIDHGEPKEITDPCKGELNSTKCGEHEVKVYTYQNDSCVEATWRGCHTDNKFDDEKTCREACVKQEKELENWKEQLHLMMPEDVKEIDKIIDGVIEAENITQPTTSEPELTTEEATTEPATSETVATTESTTATISQETTPVPTTELPTTTTTEPTTTTKPTTTEEKAGDADEVITT